MIFSIYAAEIPGSAPGAGAQRWAPAASGLLQITLPLIMPGIVAGSLLVFIGTLGFFVTPALMGGPADMMLANLITSRPRRHQLALAAAIARFSSAPSRCSRGSTSNSRALVGELPA